MRFPNRIVAGGATARWGRWHTTRFLALDICFQTSWLGKRGRITFGGYPALSLKEASDLTPVFSAQVHACAFYEAYGFIAEGSTYLDADIEHISMRLQF